MNQLEVIKVCVTQKHINKGKRQFPACCPVSYAIREALDDMLGKVYVCVYKHYFTAIMKTKSLSYNYNIILPSNAMEFIRNFDTGKQVKPFSFNIEWTDTEP